MPPKDTVARLNALFEIVVPAVVDAGGHVNKFLGDGALAVFGAPNDLAGHADTAVSIAVLIQRLVGERFDGALRIGIGISTGVVIAGTIGGGGKLEFTLIGDTVNVAARVEQLTKTTGDAILHPFVRRRSGFSTARTPQPGIPRLEGQISRGAGLYSWPRGPVVKLISRCRHDGADGDRR
jgi:class 3 adenylate cyclase